MESELVFQINTESKLCHFCKAATHVLRRFCDLATGVGISTRRLLNVRFEKLSEADLLEAVVHLSGNYTPANTIISGRGTEH